MTTPDERKPLLSSEDLSDSPRSTPAIRDPVNRGPTRGDIDRNISPIVSEDDRSITIRRPLQYYSIRSPEARALHTERTRAQLHRYRYYNKLSPHRDSTLVMPNHIVPPEFFFVIPVKLEGKQNSLVTIFAIWNTMMGTSLLSMPWAVQQAGLLNAILIMLVFAGLALYTAYRVLKSQEAVVMNLIQYQESYDVDNILEFSDVCRYYLGRGGEYVSVFFSMLALLGASTVYWVLMSNFMYHVGYFIYEKVHPSNTSLPLSENITGGVLCPNPPFAPDNITAALSSPQDSTNSSSPYHIFSVAWNQRLTVPFYLLLIMLPLCNFKSPTFFTKFNSMGTLAVIYIITFVWVKASHWGVNVDFTDVTSIHYTRLANTNFPSLTGILALAYFLHNCVISIMRNQKQPEHNGRDLSIAYILVSSTYVIIGYTFYISFPLVKDCINENLLDNFLSGDVMAFVARIFLFFQIVTVFPLLMYIMRVQVMHPLFGDIYPSVKHVVIFNILILCFCLLFAVFLPSIGTITRFSGAICGLVYVFTLPCVIYMLQERKRGSLSWPSIIFHSIIPVIGVANVIGQFVILGH